MMFDIKKFISLGYEQINLIISNYLNLYTGNTAMCKLILPIIGLFFVHST
jgi:hypothetical protein